MTVLRIQFLGFGTTETENDPKNCNFPRLSEKPLIGCCNLLVCRRLASNFAKILDYIFELIRISFFGESPPSSMPELVAHLEPRGDPLNCTPTASIATTREGRKRVRVGPPLRCAVLHSPARRREHHSRTLRARCALPVIKSWLRRRSIIRHVPSPPRARSVRRDQPMRGHRQYGLARKPHEL